MTERVYPEAIENSLDVLVESCKLINDEKYPMHEVFLRETFGKALFEHWLSGSDDNPLDEEKFHALLKIAIAKSMVQELQDDGLIDSIEDGEGEEVVFLTSKGRELAPESLNYN